MSGQLDSRLTHKKTVEQWSLVTKGLASGSERPSLSFWYFVLWASGKFLNSLNPSFPHLKNTDNSKSLKGSW